MFFKKLLFKQCMLAKLINQLKEHAANPLRLKKYRTRAHSGTRLYYVDHNW